MNNDRINEECNVLINVRRDGEIVDSRSGHNVWTNAGREYSCLVKTLNSAGQRFRSDSIFYMGVGVGTQVESPSVTRLVEPITYSGNQFLKPISHSLTTFPDNGSRLTVRYSTIFNPADLASDDVVYISECGLFTNGHATTFEVGRRDTTIGAAPQQSPVAYHSFEPIPKTSNVEIEIIWELRH